MCHNPMDGCLPFLAPSSASTQTTSSSSWLPHLHRPPSLAPGVSTAKGQPVRRHIHLLSITIVFVSSFKGKSTLLPCRNSQARLRSSSILGDPVSSLCAGSRPDRERKELDPGASQCQTRKLDELGMSPHCPGRKPLALWLCGVHGRSCCRVHQPG